MREQISGTCGRLMCCLKYEQEAYEDLIRNMPKQDAQVDTPKGKGTVAEVNLLRRTVKVRLAEGPDTTSLQSWNVDRLGYTLNGEYKEPIPEEPKAEEEKSELRLLGWLEEGKPISLTPEEEPQPKKSGRSRNRNRKKPGPKPEQAKENASKQVAPKQPGQKPAQKQTGGDAGKSTQQPRRKGQSGGKPQGEKKPQGEGKKPQNPREGQQPQGSQNQQGSQGGGKKSGRKPFYRSRRPKNKESQP